MFFLVPIRIGSESSASSDRRTGPVWANSLVVAINVVVYTLGWSASWAVGRGSSIANVLLYGFAHADLGHLLANCWVLLVFGHAVNRRIGNEFYLLSYLGTILAVGVIGWLLVPGILVGSSGGVFAMLAIAALLLPGSRMQVGFVALLPISLLVGLVRRPREWVEWFLVWARFETYVFWCLVIIPVLEVWGLLSWWFVLGYWNWTNLAHLAGFACGVAAVLLLPDRIVTTRRSFVAT